ncbi:MAG: phosphatase PAP2 family protein [Candidatus Eisenbacteria bacterium]|uniref:Phosphatase PAP2 family protein n=1 Tax=Eiseniibacteriota bacterium TaxID=2212470 RepID=A0A7Y2ECT1_UNCEI|nr:phosphatase PAP2 family protein [Candidatus Eisenbacteria bacterium]
MAMTSPATSMAQVPPHSASPQAFQSFASSSSSGSSFLGPRVRQTGTLFAAATIASYIAWHEEDPHAIQGFTEKHLDTFLVDVGDTFGSGFVAGGGTLGLYLLGNIQSDETMIKTSQDLAQGLMIMAGVVGATKVAVGRSRPNGGSHSFPSGHTATAFTTAAILNKRMGKEVGIPAYVLATFTGLGRMEDKKHYLSDVIAGAALGIAISNLVVGEEGDLGYLDHVYVGAGEVGLSVGF